MFTLLIVGCALLGLAIGSFLNVVIYRVPRQLSVVRPRSACPTCSTPILERDNIPVISWLLLGRKCRHCHAPISARYPLVELACGGLFAVTAARFGAHWELPAYLVFAASLLALGAIDFEHLKLPKAIVYWALGIVSLLLVLASATEHQWHRLVVALICSFAWFGVFFLINLASPKALGFGDVRLALVLGATLGWLGVGYVVIGFFISNLVGAVTGVSLIALKKIDRKQPVPYGVFLAVGVEITIFLLPLIATRYSGVTNL